MKTSWTDLEPLAGAYRKEVVLQVILAKLALKPALCIELRNRLEARLDGITGLTGSKEEFNLQHRKLEEVQATKCKS